MKNKKSKNYTRRAKGRRKFKLKHRSGSRAVGMKKAVRSKHKRKKR